MGGTLVLPRGMNSSYELLGEKKVLVFSDVASAELLMVQAPVLLSSSQSKKEKQNKKT